MNKYIGLGVNPIIADFNFDEGSAVSITKTTNIRIVPWKTWNNLWAWYCIKISGLAGKTMHFLINKADHYNLVAGERLCCWANEIDTDDWHDFDVVNIGAVDIEFYNHSTFVDNTIYVSHLPMYPFSRVQRKVNEWLLHNYVSDTSGSVNGILGYSTWRSNGDGRISPVLPFYGFKITGDRVGNKNKAILTAYNHPSETPGPFQLEGAIDWLLSGSATAETLLDYFEFYVYPCLNPQGVYGGYFRSCPQDPTKDHNRQWISGGLECVDTFKTAMLADTGGTINVGIDYHSWMSNIDCYVEVQSGDSSGNYAFFLSEMQALDTGYSLLEEDINTALRYLWRGTYSASLSISLEQGGDLTRNPTIYKTNGVYSMQALYEMLIDGRFTYQP